MKPTYSTHILLIKVLVSIVPASIFPNISPIIEGGVCGVSPNSVLLSSLQTCLWRSFWVFNETFIDVYDKLKIKSS